jgi:hypothetical protein
MNFRELPLGMNHLELAICVRIDGVWHPLRARPGPNEAMLRVDRDLLARIPRARTAITIADICTEILKIDPMQLTRGDQMNIGRAMLELGWTKRRVTSSGLRCYIYVRQEADPAEAGGGWSGGRV